MAVRSTFKVLRLALAAMLIATLPFAAGQRAAVADGGSGGLFVPVNPLRIADSVSGSGTAGNPIPSAATRTITVLGVGGVPDAGVGAVVLDIAAKSTDSATLYAYADGESRGGSFLKLVGGDGWDSNTVVVKPGVNGKVAIFNSTGSTSFNVDVQGYFTATRDGVSPGGYVPIQPTRVVSTTAGTGVPSAQLRGGTSTEIAMGGTAGIPMNASAVFANVRVFNANYSGNARVGASDAPPTSAVTMNFSDGTFNDSGVAIKLGPDGRALVTMSGAATHRADLFVDVQGYFTNDSGSGSSYTPLGSHRIFDSRHSVAIPPNGQISVTVAGRGGVPADGSAGAVAVSIFAIDWQATGSLRVFNPDRGTPNTTNIASSRVSLATRSQPRSLSSLVEDLSTSRTRVQEKYTWFSTLRGGLNE